MTKRSKQPFVEGELRIIAGKFRHRKIHFPSLPGIRPTPNRVRETLFNWLSPYIIGAHCLDLFAGSGALSIEAISRGAASCVALDNELSTIRAIDDNKLALGIDNLEIIQAQFPYNPALLKESFDLVFLDPPFGKGYVDLTLNWLQQHKLIKQQSLIYIEIESNLDWHLPGGWCCIKDKIAGEVRYLLVKPSA